MRPFSASPAASRPPLRLDAPFTGAATSWPKRAGCSSSMPRPSVASMASMKASRSPLCRPFTRFARANFGDGQDHSLRYTLRRTGAGGFKRRRNGAAGRAVPGTARRRGFDASSGLESLDRRQDFLCARSAPQWNGQQNRRRSTRAARGERHHGRAPPRRSVKRPHHRLRRNAITDRRDVIPTAVEKSCGRVTHFGMPVDPGNLC